MFWILTAAMVLMVAAAILRPFLGRRDAVAEPPAAYDLRVYRDQLREVDRDVARKVLAPDEAERLRVEIGRKVLEADRALSRQTTVKGHAPRPVIAAALLLLLIGASGWLYRDLGAPQMPDMPLKERIADADARIANRPSQAEVEKSVPPRPPVEAPADYVKLVEQLREAVAKRPDDPQGLALLAEHEARLGNMVAARTAQQKLVEVHGADATSLEHARLAGLMIEAAGGVVSKEASEELTAALKLDRQNGQARYLTGLMYAQNDRPDLAFPIWRELLETSAPDAPWMDPIRQLMPDLAWLAGEPNYQMPDADAPGPDADAVAAASQMTDAERQQMIRGMVEGLEQRLSSTGGSGAEWARLIGALNVLGEKDKAQALLVQGRAALAGDPPGLAMLNDAAAKAGLQ